MLGALDGGLVGRKDTERAKGVCGLGAEMIDGFVHNPEALRGGVELKEVAVDPSKVLHSCVHGEHVHAVEQRPGLFDHGAVDRLYPDVDDALAVVWQLINGVRESTSDVAGFSEDGGGCIAVPEGACGKGQVIEESGSANSSNSPATTAEKPRLGSRLPPMSSSS